ncbi:hypothetical protein L1278_001947 [Pontibacter sp. HSC-36F09]|nr:hypothetical protein [Pontibacter sp. HSC-36F09]
MRRFLHRVSKAFHLTNPSVTERFKKRMLVTIHEKTTPALYT